MTKTVKISDETHRRLEEMKPYDSVSFNDIITELIDERKNGQEATA